MAKTEAETLQQISVWWMKSEGYFTNGTAPLLMGISFTATACHFGGKRFWLVCSCDRRVGVLYEWAGNFKCRICLNLTYKSQNMRKTLRNDTLLSACDSFIEAQELIKKMKRYTYAGKPTRKSKKLSNLYSRFFHLF